MTTRGLKCAACGMQFTDDPAWSTVMWDLEADDGRRPQVAFLYKDCVTEGWDRAYIYCGGGAWFAVQDQAASLDRILAWRALLYLDGKAVERYKTFCENGSMQGWPIGC